MNQPLRRCAAALLILPLMVLLAGCIKFNSRMSISSDDKVDATMLIAVQKQFGAMVREACNGKSSTTMPNATVTDYSADDYVGCTLDASGIPMSQLAKSGGSWSFGHKNGQYSFKMKNTNANTGGARMAGKMFTAFKLAVTFPGDVTSHNGSSTVEGRTVTWTDPDDMFTGEGLKATSKEAPPVQAAMPLPIGLIALLAAAGLGAVIWTVVRRRRTASVVEPRASEVGTFSVHYPPSYTVPTAAREPEPTTIWPSSATPPAAAPGSEPSGTRDGSPES